MEFKNGKVYLSESDQRNANVAVSVLSLGAASVLAESLMEQARQDSVAETAWNLQYYPNGINPDDTLAIPVVAWRKQTLAEGLIGIVNDNLMDEITDGTS